MQTCRTDFAASLILREGCAIHRPSLVIGLDLPIVLTDLDATTPVQFQPTLRALTINNHWRRFNTVVGTTIVTVKPRWAT
jgi:hypothetical protein